LLKQNSQVIAQSGQQKIKAVQEGIGGIRDVLLDQSQDFFERVYQEAERVNRQATATNLIIAQSPRFLLEALSLSAIALLALGLGRDGDFSQAVPVLGSFALGAKRLLPAVQEMFATLAAVQGARASLVRVRLALQRSVDPLLAQPVALPPLPLHQELRLANVWFRYGEDLEWVLQNLDLKIAAKTTVAFVGSTGSGKSTTADVILGLLQPERGAVLVDGESLEGLRLLQWQRGIAHVPQHIFLSDGTMAENIAFGVAKDQIDRAQVEKAARMAQIADFIEGLPDGYDSIVGERGIRLSGGQRQRIGIARALYRRASVMVLDEATSALDNATEREVMGAIEALSGELTIILIAHRLSTVERCDLVVELSQGRVVAQGTYGELLERSVSFRQMAALG
jgi:ATP-binding cassette subfamily B protein